MAWSYTESGNNTASTSWAVSYPSAVADDLLLFYIGWDDSTTTTGLTAPAGPNGESAVTIENIVASSNTAVRQHLVYYIATGTWTASTLAFTPSASEQWTAAVVKIPAGEWSTSDFTGAQAYAPSTAAEAPTLPALVAGAGDGNGTVVGFIVSDTDNIDGSVSGWTSRVNTDRGAVGINIWTRDALATASESIASASGWTYPVNRDWVSFIHIVKPQLPPTVALNSPADASSGSDTTPTLDFTGTDSDGDDVRFQLQVNNVSSWIDSPATYYFDGSDAAATDPNSVWTNDANVFDGSIATTATVGVTGSTSSNYLMAEGTNAADNGGTITQVNARIYGGSNTESSTFAAIYTDGLAELLGTPSKTSGGSGYGSYTTLSTPSGGWTWAKIQALETKIYITDGGINPNVAQVEIEVNFTINLNKYSGSEPLIDHVTSLANANSTSLSSSHITTNHPNRLTVIVATVDAGSPNDVNSVTVGGNAATQLAESTFGGNKHAEIWYYIGTSIGSATVQINTDSAFISGAVYDIYNVDQADPFSGSATSQGTDGAPTRSITPDTAYSLLIDIVCSDSVQASPDNGTLQHTQTFTFNETRSSSRRALDTSAKTMSYGTGAGDWAMVVASVKPATADTGFANPDVGGDTDPFTSGDNIQYTVQAGDALADGTYYWRVRGIDPLGSNTYGAWSSTRSFTITSATTTTKTITGIARIEKSVTQTLTGRARVTASTLQTLLGRARITVSTTQTMQGLSRITASASQTIQGLARITASTTQTIAGKADILKSTSQTIQGLAAIVNTVTQAIQGQARITASATQTLLGKSRVTASASQTIQGLSRITISTTQTLTGLARVTATSTQTILGKGDILKSATQTILGRASVLRTVAQTLQGIARITATSTQTILGRARITASTLQTIQGMARVTAIASQTILGKSAILKTVTQTINGLARVTISTAQTIAGRARITASALQTIQGLSRITITTTKTLQGIATIGSSAVQTILGIAKITATTSQTILGRARITASATQTLLGKARVTATALQTLQGLGRITASASQTIQGLGRVTVSTTKTLLGLARITVATTQTILGLSRITATASQTIQGIANIASAGITTTLQTILGKARITATSLQTITGKALIMSTVVPAQRKIFFSDGRVYYRISSSIIISI